MISQPTDDRSTLPPADDMPRGVFLAGADGLTQVHAYLGGGGDYGLEDVAELLGIGHVDERGRGAWLCLRLSRGELQELKVAADAYSFDYPAELIEMCLDMVRAAGSAPGDPLDFVANF